MMAERQQRQRLRALRNDRNLARFVVEGRATGKQLGTGSYGSVEEVEVNGLICAGKKIHDVLIDTANAGVENVAGKYVQECQLMSDLRHPNITLFLGVCFLPNCQLPVLLMERLDWSLDDLLETIPTIPLALKRSILEDVSRGLLYLHKHTPQIIHRDLTAKNVLLTSYFVAKITDLGNSRIVNLQPGQLAKTQSRLPGTLVYMPPEALSASSRYGPSLDVFSFGHLALFTLLQVFPGDLLEPNYTDPDNQEQLMARTEVERRQLYFNQLEGRILVSLIEMCLHNSPSRRPTAEQLVIALEEARATIEGAYGELATVDAVRQVRTMKALKSRDGDKVNELAAKDEEIQQLQQQLEEANERCEAELQQKNIQLEQIQVEIDQAQTNLRQKDTIIQQKDTQLEQHSNTIQQLNTQLREKDDTLRQKEEELQIQLQQKNEVLQQRNAGISSLQREVEILKNGRPYNREFYFHIQGGNRLNIARADAYPLWKDIPEVTSSYHTVQCARTTTLQNDRCINAEDIRKLKDKLKEFIEKEETCQSRMSFRFEARFGHLFFIPTDHENGSNPVTTDTLKGMKFNKEFVTRLMGCTCETEAFKQEHRTCKVDADEITYKIRFILYGAELDGGRFDGVCYVKESVGKFTLLSAHKSAGHTNEMKIDIIRPGRVYDIRVVCGVHNYDEEKVPDCVLATAKKIAKSMKRSSSSFDPEEIHLQMDGENFEVEYIREKKTCEYEWKNNPRWIFVEHDIRQLKYTKESHRILKRDGQFHPVPITFSHTDCRKEVELWSKVHSQPDLTNKWKAEELLDVNYFDKFVDSCFDIAGLLDGISAPTSTH